MKRLLIGLFKLLLQLVIFALTGSWPRFGEAAEPAPRAKQKKKQKAPRPPKARRRPPLFQPGAPSGGLAYGGEALSLEETLGARQFGEGGAAVRRARGGRALSPRAARSERPTLGSVLRSPSGLRDAIVLGEALAPRRPRR